MFWSLERVPRVLDEKACNGSYLGLRGHVPETVINHNE